MKPGVLTIVIFALLSAPCFGEATIHSLEQRELGVREARPVDSSPLTGEKGTAAEKEVPVARDEKTAPGEEGIASWYGGKFQGRKTASGEVFDTRQFTAAHRTLPFGTRLRVTNLNNGKTTTVRVNDRGPFVDDRLIDLSQAAAVEIDMMKTGVARVRIEILDVGATDAQAARYRVQAGSFKDRANARRLKETLAGKGWAVLLETTEAGHVRVHVDQVAAADLAAVQAALRALGVTRPLVRKLD